MLEKMGLKIRNALMATVYRKCLRLNNGSRSSISTGKIVTLMSNDCQTLERFVTQLHNLWASPLIVVVTLFLLYNVIQWSAFVGVGSVTLVAPVMGTLSTAISRLRKRQLEFTDKRVNIMNEVIAGIRIMCVRRSASARTSRCLCDFFSSQPFLSPEFRWNAWRSGWDCA